MNATKGTAEKKTLYAFAGPESDDLPRVEESNDRRAVERNDDQHEDEGFLFGSAGNDARSGGAGTDWLRDETGNDLRIGDAESDSFVLRGASDSYSFTRNAGAFTSPVSTDPASRDGRVNFQSIGLLDNATAEAASSAAVAAAPSPVAAFQGTDGSASAFMDFLGVNIRIERTHASYSNANRIMDALDYLNIDNVRVGAESPIGNRTLAPIYDRLADDGIEFNFLMRRDFPAKGEALIDRYADHFRDFLREHPGSIKSVESVNEVGNFSLRYKGLPEKQAAAQYQKDLYQAMNAEPALRDIPVYTFSVFRGDDRGNFSGFGNLSSFADGAAAHTYVLPHLRPYYELQDRLSNARVLDSNDPAVITEMGIPSSPIPGNSFAVNQGAQAKLNLNMIMNAYAHDAPSAYIFELFDFFNNPRDNQGNFGLFKTNGEAKESARAIHNFTTIIEKNSGGATGDTVRHELRNQDSNTHSVALAKSGGVMNVVVWREDTVFDFRSQREVNVAPRTIQVAFDERVDYVDVYDPLRGTERLSRTSNVDVINVQVSDHPIILEIDI